ncbi:MAG: hypothetical protein AAFN07_08685 [Pseudomonadota bacterium]
MNKISDIAADNAAQEQADRASGSSEASGPYGVLFDALGALQPPTPDAAFMKQIEVTVSAAQQQRARERVWLKGMLFGLVALFVLTLGISLGRVTSLLAEVPLLYPFSAIAIVTVGLLSTKSVESMS